MGLVYNYSFELAGTAILAIILIFLKVQYTEPTPSSRAFRRFVLVMLAAEILDVASGIMNNHILVLGVSACAAANTAYFAATGLVEYLLVGYIRTRVKTSPLTSFLDAVDKVLVVGYLVAIMVNSFTGWVFWFDGGTYTHGSMYLMVYFVPLYYMLSALVRVFTNTSEFSSKELVSYNGFVIVVLAGMVLQFFFLSSTLFTYFAGSIGAMILLFGLETPDYPKLMQTMSELEYLQRNLEKEVKEQTKLAVERKDQVERMSIDTVKALARAIDAKDDYTRGHSARVAEYSKLLAIELGWEESHVEALYQAALLHDIGKIGVPDTILNKPSRLESAEYEVIQTHPIVGADILKNVTSVPDAMCVARSHHERFDGKGYPDGLKGEEIPLPARLVAIADAYDAMSSRRVYRRALSRDEVAIELRAGRGSQFDPVLFDVFWLLFESGRLDDAASLTTAESAAHRLIEENYSKIRHGELEDGSCDYLTGLPLRFVAEKLIGDAMQVNSGWMLLFDIDDLRHVNSTVGHRVGDETIKYVAEKLGVFWGGSIVSRFGGDEFLCFVPEVSADVLKERLDEFTSMEMKVEGGVPVTISAGACESNRGDAFGLIFARADKALYHAKHSGRALHCVYGINAADAPSGDTDLRKLLETLASSSDSTIKASEVRSAIAHAMQERASASAAADGVTSLAMITMRESEGQILFIEEIEHAMTCLDMAAHENVRATDFGARFGGVQYLVVLTGSSKEEAAAIIDRVLKAFYRLYNANLMQPSCVIEEVDMRS